MGQDKALLDFAGAPMIAWCAAALAECAPTLVVSSATRRHAEACARAVTGSWPRFTVLRGVRVETVVDEVADSGPLAGLVSAWNFCKQERVVVSACDTPLVPAEFYRRAVGLIGEFEAVAPELEAPEPLVSAWKRERALETARLLLEKKRGPQSLFSTLRTRLVPRAEILQWGLDPARFASANTPEALERLRAIAKSGSAAQPSAPKF